GFVFLGMAVCPATAFYGVAPSTGSGLPYSVETRNLVKDLFNNRTIIGGQVIALKDEPGKNYSGNYIDVGSLAGVKSGDVFAFFTPRGEPVGFGRVVEVQRYTSSFAFIELTVDPSSNLVGKKVTHEVKRRLPERGSAYLNMANFKKGPFTSPVKKKQEVAKPVEPTPGAEAVSTQPSLPPLPNDNSSGGLNGLPDLNGQSNGSGLPPLPMDGGSPSGTLPGAGLPPLDMS